MRKRTHDWLIHIVPASIGRCLLLALTLIITGCPHTPLEQTAYRTIVGAKGFLDGVRKNHPECATRNSTAMCALLPRATSAKDFLIDAAEVYCSGPGFETGGPCNPPTEANALRQATLKLQAALSEYLQSESDLKGALK